MKAENSTYLFVYGSLRVGTGHPMQHWLEHHAYHYGKAEFQGKLYDLGDYPGVVPSETPRDTVWGDLFILLNPEQVFKKLDRYERYYPNNPDRSLFNRKMVEVTTDDGRNIEAYIYLYTDDIVLHKQIRSGDYLEESGGKIG